MKVAIFGASGIIGQHMLLTRPVGIDVVPFRKQDDCLFIGADLLKSDLVTIYVDWNKPDVIINLAGESDTDAVALNPEASRWLNVDVPTILARWCEVNKARYIHISTQAVFSGNEPPYRPDSKTLPINKYGLQKATAERMVMRDMLDWMVIRLTYILGVRPLQNCGRRNPVEACLEAKSRNERTSLVSDRWFSPLFAEDAARLIWASIIYGGATDRHKIVHLGIVRRTCRHDIATDLGVEADAVSHDSFKGIEPRPIDTTYGIGTTRSLMSWEEGLAACKRQWKAMQTRNLEDHAIEIGLFLGISKDAALERLNNGFGFQHNEVAADFRRADTSTDEGLLDWYRTTEQYIWELSAYHSDAGFNYAGMVKGIADRLEAAGAKRVLVLGDGIGEITLSLRERGFEAMYHDLAGSRTAEFAAFRFWRHGMEGESMLTAGWEPPACDRDFDAVCSFDFLEHCVDVSAYLTFIKSILKPGGLFAVQSAFAMGSGPGGSMPMHLQRNDHYEKDFDPEMFAIGFNQISSNWYSTPALQHAND